ncbi:MAG: response regulator transcription factor [Microvirgula sp.]
MTHTDLTVFIVDDDPGVRDALSLLLSLHGYRTALFSTAADFLQRWTPALSGCLLLDIRMPDMDGLTLQQTLREQGCRLPVIILTGHGDVDSARQAFRSQALDFLEKPVDEQRLLQAIEEACASQAEAQHQRRGSDEHVRRYATLTPREREIMQLVVDGRHNRDIAELLGISVRTVEVHKSRLMDKLDAASIADLVRKHLSHGTGHG